VLVAAAAIRPGRVVFFARQRSFQAAPMDLDAELGLDRGKTLRHRQLGAGGLEIGEKGHHIVRDFVAALGAPKMRHEAKQTGRRKRALGLVEGWAGDAEGGRDIADGDAVGTVASHHLVANLHQILGVEERIADEQRIADSFGMGIERAILRQGLALCVVGLGHILLP